jgi:PAS domain S-box-containing protein
MERLNSRPGCMRTLCQALLAVLVFVALASAGPARADGAAAQLERAAYQNPYLLFRTASRTQQAAARSANKKQELLALRQIVLAGRLINANPGIQQIEQGLKLAGVLRDDEARIELLTRQGQAAEDQADVAKALAFYQVAERLASDSGADFHLARIKIHRANLAADQGQYGDALALLDQAHATAERVGDRFAQARVLSLRLAFLARMDRLGSGELAEIMERHNASLALLDAGSYPIWVLKARYSLAQTLRSKGFVAEARRELQEALQEAADHKDALSQVYLHSSAAQLELQEGRPREARDHVHQANSSAAQLSLPLPLTFRLVLSASSASAALHDAKDAQQQLHQAEGMLRTLSASRYKASYFQTAAEAMAALGRHEEAFKLAKQWRRAERAAVEERNEALVAELRTKFDAERKERENAELRAREQELESRRLLLLSLLAGTIVTLGGAVLAVRHRLHQRLRAQSRLKAAVVDNALEAVITTDAAGRIVEFNPAAEAMFGLRRQNALGQSWQILVPERYRDVDTPFAEPDEAAHVSDVPSARRHGYALRADGQELSIEVATWRSVVDGQEHHTASIRDVSAQLRNAEIIERQRNELRQSEKLATMGGLLAGVAHELNNPLSVVIGRATLLEEIAHGTEMEKEARRVHDAAVRCGRIVRTFLNMARQRKTARSEIRINEVVIGAADMLGYSLRTHGIRVELRLGKHVPAVHADGDQLGQVVLNLIINAQHAVRSVAESGDIRVETGWEPPGSRGAGKVWLRVVDSGPGVPAGLEEHVFEPFFTTKGEGTGTGLGLAMSRNFAREHGGDLVLEGRNTGASFLLWLPVEAARPAPAEPTDPGMQRCAHRGGRVLVVDDEPELVDLMQVYLRRGGYEVVAASSGAQALARLGEGRIDAVVCDVRMPGAGGVALRQAIADRYPGLAPRMVFVTGDTLGSEAAKFLNGPQCRVLEKPFDAAALLSVLDATMQCGVTAEHSALG